MQPFFQTSLQSPVGIIEVTSDGDAINAVHFSDHPVPVTAAAIPLNRLPDVMKICARELELYFKGEQISFSVPVHQEGSDFQQSVWNELLRIPFGQTISYMDLSKRIGDVKAIRAVGTSNGKNKIAIIVPCHRVIGTSGSLTGYAGGLWRKQWLLEHEMKVAHGVLTLF